MYYGPPKEIFWWAMALLKYRVAPPMLNSIFSNALKQSDYPEYLESIHNLKASEKIHFLHQK
jgi:hypothetical protein